MAATCWAISEAAVGMRIQAVALAEALGYAPVVKQVAVKGWMRGLPNWSILAGLYALDRTSDAIAAPWPDLVVSCGRKAAFVALAIQKASARRTRIVHIQDPHGSRRAFDAIVAPQHDGLTGPNVITMLGSVHNLDRPTLDQEAQALGTRLTPLPEPRVTVLIGGATRHYDMDETWARRFAAELVGLLDRGEAGSLLVSVSRRTPAAVAHILETALRGRPAWFWGGEGENPYRGFLGAADALIVTSDSVNMTCEALATGRPVLSAVLPGRGSARFARFFADLAERGLVRPFTGRLERWDNRALAETRRVADLLRNKLALKA